MSDAIQQVIGNLMLIKESARVNRMIDTLARAHESIEALQALQSGEPSEWVIEVENGQVVMSRIGANFTGYLYATPQPVADVNKQLLEALIGLRAVISETRGEPAREAVQKADAAILAAQQAPQPVVPEGYVLVPTVPTEKMIDAGVYVAMAASVHGKGGWNNYIKALYKALLSAGKGGE